MTHLFCAAATVVAGLGIASCGASSDNPVAGLAESWPIPEAWLGDWAVEEILSRVPPTVSILNLERNADGSAQLILRESSGQAALAVASLSDLDGLIVASMQTVHSGVDAEDFAAHWGLLKIEVDAGGSRMSIRDLDADVVAGDIAAGTVPGSIHQIDVDDRTVNLTATSAQLRSYLASRPSAFGPVVIVLIKRPEAL